MNNMYTTITIESVTPDRQPHIVTIENTKKNIAKQIKILQNKGHHNIKPYYPQSTEPLKKTIIIN